MAIFAPEEQGIDPGRSRINPADTYSAPRPTYDDTNAEALARSLGKLGVEFNQIDQDNAERDLAKKDEFVSRVISTMGDKATEADINDIASPLHPKVRAAVQEAYGASQGKTWALGQLETPPEEAIASPEATEAWLNGVRQQALQTWGSRGFISGGAMREIESVISARKANIAAGRVAQWNQELENDLGNRVDTASKAASAGAYHLDIAQASDPEKANLISAAAKEIGLDPVDLATILSYESGFRTEARNPNKINYGLIQFGAPEQKLYGIRKGMTFAEQMSAVVRFYKDRGFKPGMSFAQAYKTVNGGNPNVSGSLKDGPTTIDQKVAQMVAGPHRRAAMKLMGAIASTDAPQRVQVAKADTGTATDASPGAPAAPATPTPAPAAKQPSYTPKSDTTPHDPGIPKDLNDLGDDDAHFVMKQRQALGQVDAEYQAKSWFSKARIRDKAADVMLGRALEERDPRYLRVIPEEAKTPAIREAEAKVTEQIERLKAADLAAAQKAQAEAHKAAVEEAKKKINDRLIDGKDLTPDELKELNKLDPDLATGYAERRSQIDRGLINKKDEQAKFNDVTSELRKKAAAGEDLDGVDISRISDPALNQRAHDQKEKLKQTGGELGDSYYSKRWDQDSVELYNGQLVPGGKKYGVNNMPQIQNNYETNLEESVLAFVEKNGRPPQNLRERSQVYTEALNATMEDFKPQTSASSIAKRKPMGQLSVDGQPSGEQETPADPPETDPSKGTPVFGIGRKRN